MNRYLIVFRGNINKTLLLSYGAMNIETLDSIGNLALCDLDVDQASLLSHHNDVRSVEKDNVDDFNDTFDAQSESYTIDLMDVKKFHEEGITGRGVKVAVLDSGIQQHKDLTIVGGYNAYNSSLPYDNNLASSHGTKVAGVIGMKDNNEGQLGVAPGCDLYAVRIDNGSGSINRTLWSAQIKAIDWCIKNKMDAINCSFSSETESEARREAFERAYEAGIAIFCSGGNRQSGVSESESTIGYPSKYPFVVTVANITNDKKRYSSSSVGRGINFSSGGVSIRSTTIDSNNKISAKYANGTGTSYASPAVLGMYALYKEKYGESRDKILQRMYVNAESIGDKWKFGRGIPKYPTNNYENIQIRGRRYAN